MAGFNLGDLGIDTSFTDIGTVTDRYTTPDAPVILSVENDVDAGTTLIAGTALAGCTIDIINELGEVIGTDIVGVDDNWVMSVPLQYGKIEVTATSTSGNISESAFYNNPAPVVVPTPVTTPPPPIVFDPVDDTVPLPVESEEIGQLLAKDINVRKLAIMLGRHVRQLQAQIDFLMAERG